MLKGSGDQEAGSARTDDFTPTLHCRKYSGQVKDDPLQSFGHDLPAKLGEANGKITVYVVLA